MPSLTEDYCTPTEAAEIIGVSHSQVTRYVDQGLLPYERIGWQLFIPRKAVAKFKRPPVGNPNFQKKSTK